MADIEKILDGLNIPKQLIDKSELLLKTLFGPSFEEFGGMIADQVKLRRFKNQIKIFTKAKEALKDNNINPQKVSLKVLAPLIEYSSYEEDENLQEMWAKLITNALSENSDILFQQNSISILNRISAEEGKLLEGLYADLARRRIERFDSKKRQYDEMRTRYPTSKHLNIPKSPESFSVTSFTFNIKKISADQKLDEKEFYFKISNLISLGLLKWETDVRVDATKSNEDVNDTSIDVTVDVYNDDDFVFTSIGERFIKLVKS